MKASSCFQIGDPVVVKAQVRDPDLDTGIGGCQGTISDISDEQNTVCVDWDSATLDAMPASVIDYCERKGLGWNQMHLAVDEVEHASRRDTPAQRAQTLARLEAAHQWSHLDPEGVLIKKVLGAVDPGDEAAMLEAWEARLQQAVRFPFEHRHAASPPARADLRPAWRRPPARRQAARARPVRRRELARCRAPSAAAALPGAVVRRLLLWRYALRWVKPIHPG